MTDQNIFITRENISLNSFNRLNISAGGGINLNNSALQGKINLDNLTISGSMNARLQTSIFNQFDDQLVNSKNSKCEADQYGAVYGPSYGDTLGTVNCRGAFIGTETTGYIGSTYSATLDEVSKEELTMTSLVSLQTQSSSLNIEQATNNSSNNTAIPMNITSYSPDLKNLKTISYNTVGNPGKELFNDPYFGNIWAITRNGLPESIPTLANTLTQDLRTLTRINISKTERDQFDVTGNLILRDHFQTFIFDEIIVENKTSLDAAYNFVDGNVLVNGIGIIGSTTQLEENSQSDLNSLNANLTGNFQFNSNITYPDSTIRTININGNISNIGYGNYIQWPNLSYNPIPEIGNAHIDFPKNFASSTRFDEIYANIVYFNNNVMNGTASDYNELSPPLYGNFIEKIYNNLGIYNDTNNSQISDNFVYINNLNANEKKNNIPNYQLQFPVDSDAFVLGNIISVSTPINPVINNYIYPNDINSTGTNFLYNHMDTWVKYLKWQDPSIGYISPYEFNNYVITNDFTLNGTDDDELSVNYYGYSQGNIKNKAWRILDDLSPEPKYNINGTLMWAFQSGVFSSNTSSIQAYDPNLNRGLNENEATYMLFSDINTTDFPMTNSSHNFTISGIVSVNGFQKYYDLLTVAYVDYTDSLIQNSYSANLNNFKKEVLGTLKPGNTYSTFTGNAFNNDPFTYVIDNTSYSSRFKVNYLLQSVSSETDDMSTLTNFSYSMPRIASGYKRMIIIFYMKSSVITDLNDLARITNISLTAGNFNRNDYLQQNLFYGWNLKLNTTINDTVSSLLSDDSLLYLSTGQNNLQLYDNNATYLLAGPIKAIDFDKQNFYQQYLYCEVYVHTTNPLNCSGEFRVYRVESDVIIADSDLVSDVLLSNQGTYYNGVAVNILNNNTGNWLTIDTSGNNLFVYPTLTNTKYVYYVVRFINYYSTSCIVRNLRISQKPLNDYTIFSYTIDSVNNQISSTIDISYFPTFTLNYPYDLVGSESVTPSDVIILSGKIKNDNALVFNASLTVNNGNISGNIFIYGGNVFSNLAITGTKTSGDPNNFNLGGNVVINSNVNYWNTDFYQYAWHANLINSSIVELPPITPDLVESYPFAGINGKLILQCGIPSVYNESNNKYIERPLFDNQFSMMTWTFAPKVSSVNPLLASDFTIGFKYQLYTELRGDFFYFQYSPDAGRTYYDLLKQSGDIKSVKSVALYTTSLWKQVEFYLPGGNKNSKYIFRWIYKKDLGISNGYDIVYLADLFVNYTKSVVIDNNGYTQNYSNEFIGNITTGSSISGITAYNLPFLSASFTNGYINKFGQTNMDGQQNEDMYTKITTYYRQDLQPNDYLYPSQNQLNFRVVDNNSGGSTGKVWRLNDYNTLKSILGSPINKIGLESLLDINATTGFLGGSEMALMSSDPNNGTTDNGLTHGEATYLALGPFDYTNNDSNTYYNLTTKAHQLQFKYIPDTENSFDLTGVITYDYVLSGGQTDDTVKDTLIKLLTFNKTFHLLQQDLNQWYNSSPNIIDISNIKYYPSDFNYNGIYNSSTIVSGWLNFSANIPAMTGSTGQKRIYVIYFAKDYSSISPNNDVVIIHDIKFTFDAAKSSTILDKNGYLYGSEDNNSFKITNVTDNDITIKLQNGNSKKIYLSATGPPLPLFPSVL